MAEPTPSSDPMAAGAAAPETAVQPPRPAFPAAPTAPALRPEAEAYQPLAPLAVLGASLALIYAVIVIVGAVAALLNRSPWLMPTWTILVPLVTAALSAAGWFSVHISEGTRAGKNLAVAGVALSLVVGLGYWAYYAGTYFAVRAQANDFTLKWFDEIKKGDIDSAFRLTIEPSGRPRMDAGLHNELEVRFNTMSEATSRSGGGGGKGPLSFFEQHDVVRLIRLGGDEARIEPLGVASWEYAQGGYKVRRNYKITTPDLELPIRITVQSSAGAKQQFEQRQWYVVMQESLLNKSEVKPTERGARLAGLKGQSGETLRAWQEYLMGGQIEASYLATIPAEQREKQATALRQHFAECGALGFGSAWTNGWAALIATCRAVAPSEQVAPGFAEYGRGALVHYDKDKFWVGGQGELVPPTQERYAAEVRKLFRRHEDGPPGALSFESTRILYWRVVDGRLQVMHDAECRFASLNLVVEADLVVECDASYLDSGPPALWRLVGLELRRGRIVPAGRGGPNQRPGPDRGAPKGGPPR